MTSARVRNYNKEASKNLIRRTEGFQDRTNPDFVKAPAVAKNEETVLGLMLYMPNHRKRVICEGMLSEDDFFTEFNKRVFLFFKEHSGAVNELPLLDEFFTPDEVGRITRMRLARADFTDNGDVTLEESIANLKNSVSKKKSKQTNTMEELNAILARKRND